MATKWTIRQLQTGWQYLDKGMYGTYGRGYGTIIQQPVFAFLLEGGGRRILVDTGMSDTQHSVKYHHDGLQEPGQAIHEQLAKLGLEPDDVDTIVFTHLHWDHCYNLERFRRAKLFAHEREHRFALDPIPFYWNSYEAPQTGIPRRPFDGRTFELLTGEAEIVEGVRAFPTPGHSVGHMAVEVSTEGGAYVIAGDLALLAESFQPDRARGWPFTPPGRFANIIDVWHSLEEVKRRAGAVDHILLTHEPSQIGKDVYR